MNNSEAVVIGGSVSPVAIDCGRPVKVVRIVISKCAPGPKGPKGDSGKTAGTISGIVGGGGIDDPISGTNTFQSYKLIGVATGGKLKIEYAEQLYSCWGNNASFNFDSNLGRIVWTNGITFYLGDTFYINLNQ